MDCDMLVLDDIARLWDLRDDRYAALVVKHDQPAPGIHQVPGPTPDEI